MIRKAFKKLSLASAMRVSLTKSLKLIGVPKVSTTPSLCRQRSTVSVPIIGIGSGVNCDGQVLVVQDLLGMYDKIKPKFAKRYMNLAEAIEKSLGDYKKDVESGTFPAKEHWFSMNEEELEKLREEIGS